MKQHEDVKEKVTRQPSILTVYKGKTSAIITEYQQQQEDDKFDTKGVEEEDEKQEVIAALLREYLVDLMEIGYLWYELKQ